MNIMLLSTLRDFSMRNWKEIVTSILRVKHYSVAIETI